MVFRWGLTALLLVVLVACEPVNLAPTLSAHVQEYFQENGDQEPDLGRFSKVGIAVTPLGAHTVNLVFNKPLVGSLVASNYALGGAIADMTVDKVTDAGHPTKDEYAVALTLLGTARDGEAQVRFPGLKDKQRRSLDAAYTFPVDGTPPAVATGVTASVDPARANAIIVSFTKPSDSDYDRTNIVATPAIGYQVNVINGASSEAIGGLQYNTVYTFELRTVDDLGNSSAPVTVVGTTGS